MTAAIFGILDRGSAPVDPAQFSAMSAILAHRGPVTAFWSRGRVALGARSNRKGSSSAATGADGGGAPAFVVVADARLDNRDELASILGHQGRRSAVSDEQLILSAYCRWGVEAPTHLIGDFAFALWDAQRGALFCARDPVGVKRLYYHLSEHRFAVATEIKALLVLDEVPRDLDEVQVAFFLDGFVEDRERTFYKRVRRLPGGCSLQVGARVSGPTEYWTPSPDPEVRLGSDQEYADAFRELFVRAVRDRLKGASQVGAALSGGLDSSSIVCVARPSTPTDSTLHTFSAVFPSLPKRDLEGIDERSYVAEVIALDGVVNHEVRTDRLDPFHGSDRLMWHLDAPSLGFNLYMHWALFEEAWAVGVDVFLDGSDGDSVVSHGYERFPDLVAEGQWGVAAAEALALASRFSVPPERVVRRYLHPHLASLFRRGMWRSWWRGCMVLAGTLGASPAAFAMRSGPVPILRGCSRALGRRAHGAATERTLIRKSFSREVQLHERKQDLVAPGTNVAKGRAEHANGFARGLLQHALEMTEAAGAAFQVEPRFPYLDRRLMDFCFRTPVHQKLANGWPRWIQRQAMKDILPPSIQWRVGKANLSANFRTGMGRFLDSGCESGSRILTEVEPYVDLDELQARLVRFRAGRSSTMNADSMELFKVAMLGRWLTLKR